eukprot:924132-Pelagomonas_calceolata.AAC.3
MRTATAWLLRVFASCNMDAYLLVLVFVTSIAAQPRDARQRTGHLRLQLKAAVPRAHGGPASREKRASTHLALCIQCHESKQRQVAEPVPHMSDEAHSRACEKST